MSPRLRACLQLLRVPNLFTVPGDPLCGFLLASGGVWSWRAFSAVGAGLCLYSAGLVLNDLADLSEDRRDRPSRPLPSRAISPNGAFYLVYFFIAAGIALAILTGRLLSDGATLLLGAILLYNYAAKKSAFFGPLCMGLCRALNVLLGALAFASLHDSRAGGNQENIAQFFAALIHALSSQISPLASIAAGIIGLYILGVSILARTEMKNRRIPPLIGQLIRGLIFIQAAFCALAGGPAGWIAAAVLLALWPISRLVASHFYAS